MPANHELCLLSLDGGGIRGVSTLLILKRLMEAINPEDPPKPCDYFHMICGTSTGGLIALMLGRMRLTIDECIAAYKELSPLIFTKLHHRIKLSNGETQGRFDHEAIETGVKLLLERHGFNPNELLKEKFSTGACKTFVCATSEQTGKPVVLSSYYNERRGTDMLNIVKIWEAVRATAAATTFFDPITIGDENFVDGATGANNPISYLWTEAGDVWAERDGSLEDNIKCIVSIGTGIPSLEPFGPSLKQVAKALKATATDTEEVAELFRKHHTQLYNSKKAFRFNVIRGLEKIGLEEVSKWGEITAATRNYIQMEGVHVQMKVCAENLQEREWLKTIRKKLLNLIRPAITTLNDDEVHPAEEELEWFVHTKAYWNWKTRGSDIIWYQSSRNCSDTRKGVAAAVAYRTTRQYESFAGERLGVGSKMARALYFQCDRRMVEDDYDPDAPELVTPEDVLRSLICQCLIVDCKTVASINRRILQLDENTKKSLHDAVIGYRTQPIPHLFNVLLQSLRLVESGMMLAIDNIHLLQDSVRGGFVPALLVFIEKRVPQVGLKLPTLISACMSSGLDEQLTNVPSVGDDTEREECIQSLYFREWNLRRDQVAVAEAGTNEWIWLNDQYRRWQDARAAVLWVEGKPGSGKSVLAKSLQARLSPSLPRAGTGLSTSSGRGSNKTAVLRSKVPDGPLVADWFYSTRMGRIGTTHLSLLRSVLYQLLELDKDFFKFVAPIYRGHHPADGSETHWNTTKISHILEKISESGTSLVCIIDAMDEAEDTANSSRSKPGISRTETILNILFGFLSGVQGSRVKFIVLSRPDPSIELDFNHRRKYCPATYKIVLEHENQGDIEVLIDKGLKTLRKAIHAYDSDSEDDDRARLAQADKYKGLSSARTALSKSESMALDHIRSYLQKEAEGVILWVTLILKELENLAYAGFVSLPKLEKHVKTLPRELDALYEHIARAIQGNSSEADILRTRFTFMLISGSASLGRPLRAREIWEALAIPDNVQEALKSTVNPIKDNRISINSWTGFRRQLRKRCGPLIEIVSAWDMTSDFVSHGDTQGDIGPDAIVQFMHRTVKDFLLSPDRSGPLHFPEEMAVEKVKLTARKYLQIAFPEEEPSYGPQISRWVATKWRENISEFVEYLEDQILLPFSLVALNKLGSSDPKTFGYLAHAYDLVFEGRIVVKEEELKEDEKCKEDKEDEKRKHARHQIDSVLKKIGAFNRRNTSKRLASLKPPHEEVESEESEDEYGSEVFRKLKADEPLFSCDAEKYYPDIKTMQLVNRSSYNFIALGESFHYACTNGFRVATQNLLEIYTSRVENIMTDDYLYAMGNGALLAAIQHNLYSEVRSLTRAYRHQSRLLQMYGAWPIGRNADKKELDPFVQLAVRCGSIDIVDFLFDHTDRFYARQSAIREFAVNGTGLDSLRSKQNSSDEDCATQSVRSFDLAQLGLIDRRGHGCGHRSTPDGWGVGLPLDFEQDDKSVGRNKRLPGFDGLSSENGGDAIPVLGQRDRRRERKVEQRGYAKLRETCIRLCHNIHKIASEEGLNRGKYTEDIKESLKLVIDACCEPGEDTMPYPIHDDGRSMRSNTWSSEHETHLQEDAFARFVERNALTTPRPRSQQRPSRKHSPESRNSQNATPRKSYSKDALRSSSRTPIALVPRDNVVEQSESKMKDSKGGVKRFVKNLFKSKKGLE